MLYRFLESFILTTLLGEKFSIYILPHTTHVLRLPFKNHYSFKICVQFRTLCANNHSVTQFYFLIKSMGNGWHCTQHPSSLTTAGWSLSICKCFPFVCYKDHQKSSWKAYGFNIEELEDWITTFPKSLGLSNWDKRAIASTCNVAPKTQGLLHDESPPPHTVQSL